MNVISRLAPPRRRLGFLIALSSLPVLYLGTFGLYANSPLHTAFGSLISALADCWMAGVWLGGFPSFLKRVWSDWETGWSAEEERRYGKRALAAGMMLVILSIMQLCLVAAMSRN